MWSFGAILDLDDRRGLQKFFIEDPTSKAAGWQLPPLKNNTDFIFNYFINDNGSW
jgi:hypothetical protein